MFTSMTTMVSGGYYEATTQNIEKIAIPKANEDEKQAIADLAEQCQQQAVQRYQLEKNVRELLIENFRPENNQYSLNKKLLNWWRISEIKTLNQEARKAFKLKKSESLAIDLSNPSTQIQWKGFLEEQSQSWQKFTDEITSLEQAINQQVYALFKLTADEIICLETCIDASNLSSG
jgi:hypothetical protein